MPTQSNNRSLFWVCVVALVTTSILLGAMIFSALGVWQFWSTASVTCVECLKSFLKTFAEPRHLMLAILFVWSTYRFTKVVRYLFREWMFSRSLRQEVQTTDGVYLLPTSVHAAWSAGIFSQAICVSDSFWKQLSSDERVALVAHESWHLKQGDVWLFFLLGYVQQVFADPLSRRLLSGVIHQLYLEREARADQAAVYQTSQRVLGSLLLKALVFEGSAPLAAPGLETVLHERVRMLAGKGGSSKHISWASFVPVLTFGVLMVLMPILFPPMVQCLFT